MDASELTWDLAEYGADTLLFRGAVVGRAFTFVWSQKGKGKAKANAAWRAVNEELGIPDSGPQSARNREDARTACEAWVMSKGEPPPAAPKEDL